MSKLKPRGKPFAKGHGDLRTPEGKTRAVGALRNLSKRSEAARRANISKALKGRKISDKVRTAAKTANTGRKHSSEEIAKRAAAITGRKMSAETKAKIGRANSRTVHKTDESKRARTSARYKTWRAAVYKRDDYACQKCGTKGGRLHPHHIVNFAEAPKLRYRVANGITFCVYDHRLFHSVYGKKGNTAEQVVEFVK